MREPAPGLAAARNAALDAAGEARLLAFLDDDEEPGPGGSRRSSRRGRRTRATRSPAPPSSGSRRTRRSGSGRPDSSTARVGRPVRSVEGAASNNLLLDLDSIRRLDLRFDEAFGLTGGEDTMLTRRLTSLGGVDPLVR